MIPRQAAIAAASSTHKHRLGAVLVKGGRVLATGYNRVGHKAAHGDWPDSVHAEVMAISKLLKPKHFHKLHGCKLFVTRIRKNGKTALAKPCEPCLSLIKSVGIKEIIYTTDEQAIERIKI